MLDFVHDVHAVDDAAEDDVFVVEEGGRDLFEWWRDWLGEEL